MEATWRSENKSLAMKLDRFLKKTGIDTLSLRTDRPYIEDVRALFKRRARKRR